MRKIFATICFCFSLSYFCPAAPGPDRHVVLVVWDGMRPDFVTATNTPTLFQLSKRGVFFAKNHSVYVSSTEVNGTALATGAYPQHSGVIGNREYRPDLNPSVPIATESLDAMRKADRQGGYLAVPTVAESCSNRAIPRSSPERNRSCCCTTAPNARTTRQTSFYLKAKRCHALRRRKSPTPSDRSSDKGGTKTNCDLWTARALTEVLWKKEVPAFSLLWLAEPDNTQHATGVGLAPSHGGHS